MPKASGGEQEAATSHGVTKSMVQKRGRDTACDGEVAAEPPAGKRARFVEGPDLEEVKRFEKVSVDYTVCWPACP